MSEAPDTGESGSRVYPPAAALFPDRHVHWPGWLALLLAVVALALVIAGWLHFSRLQQQQLVRQNAELQALNQKLDALGQTAALKSQLDSAQNSTQQALKNFGDQLDSMNAAVTDLRRRSERGRDAWIKAEAAALLMAANDQVQLNADPALALKALASADERLRLLSDPGLIPVRQQIAKEEAELRSVPQADITGMAATLTSLSESAGKFPLKRVAPENYMPGDAAPAATSGNMKPTLWQRFKAGLERLARDIFTVQRRNQPIEPLLTPQQDYFLRQNLELRLAAARAALLQRDSAAFQSSVQLARSWLETYFNPRDGGVKSAIAQLAQMQQQQIDPPLPDISASLTLLRRLEPPRATAP
ncbi:MAG: uroporphyrinogen-III C-methyltransferase [Gammaproteobacteria bacterium]|nr:uroporphyrinogen-III C-methyltransferase [Gammaproteobacteria bacterium]MBU6510051.1 uroporphyrinogen-III C-methyltransferase [Gammaproteobacteria bacterium]MDE1984278.1 uroporphyrinogen-III C-methyltransferase [Gammaproteobacteria bacterium]MDE2108395.1 uroporphyrinogen-III C-methyltransferase [Gammaproteobacteria bacterium]MDE2461959.1 uroporphyrinogen-III C-methyltransferase [Gammaproteobacteria bacterium]